MTRDDLIEQCARAAEQNFGCDCRFAPCSHDDQRVFSGVQVRALKSKPPEKSPEVVLETPAEVVAELRRKWNAMVIERDALRAEVERFKWQQAGSPMPGETPLNE